MKSSKRKIPSPFYIFLVPLLVYLFKAMEVIFPVIKEISLDNGLHFLSGVEFVSANIESNNFVLSNFISAFGILYGVLLPLVLVRTLEIYSNLDQEFEIEANAVKILYTDFLLLSKSNRILKKRLIESALKYVLHVKDNHQDEAKDLNKAKIVGDEILENIRLEFIEIINYRQVNKAESEVVVSELVQRLNELENSRTKRIGFSRQMFSGAGFQVASTLTASVFLIPFYFIGFGSQSSLLENLLVISLTLIVIFLNTLIDDLNQPYNGIWKIGNKSWQRIANMIKASSVK